MPPGLNRHRPAWQQLAGLLLLVSLLGLAPLGKARANCQENTGTSAVNFSLPSTITVASNTVPGDILYTSPVVSPTNTQTLSCNGTTYSGIVNNIGAQPSSGNTLYPTNVPGVSFRILHPDTSNPLHAYPDELIPPGIFQFSVASSLQLVATGIITNGSQLSGQIAQWNIDRYQIKCRGHSGKHHHGNNCNEVPVGPEPVQLFTISSVRFVAPACTITTDPTNVTLPPVLSSQFSGMGSTTGTTPFAVQLNCSNLTSLSITLQTSNPVNGTTGVIAPAGAGYAQGVGVQLLDQNDQPVQFGTAISAGLSQSGVVSIPFSARYYQTGVVSGGQVKATATYTINYP
ncbi:fimbrial protein [Oleiagrimonas sp.]|jgi:type 1 fimbria pilin|uniref:fimbrial protein n=1 Tax=Oleiagrimonas sp. TaxID=2010330 RepID=UPI00261E31D4|nr:fimbrial protein [Oleiagrimonas sp.]MDA3914394.1 fimbrial protein [Oleiagrimonas sp.]